MNIEKVISEIQEKYPGVAVFADTENGAAEVIAEIEPTNEHTEYSRGVAVVGKSRAHYHTTLVETYTPINGDLTVYIDNDPHIVKKGEHITIQPGQVHWAEGNEIWFHVTSRPGWKPTDHFRVG